ncbi:MAG: alpha-amylase, partial [Myxococcales bacterium]|nr:alpha-amylase [Myxococcales bacterium]
MTRPALPRLAATLLAALGLTASACGSTKPAPEAASAEPPEKAPEVALKPTPPAPLDAEGWWRDAVFYEIFVRSFQDSDGDGVGDLRGVTQRLDYLADLGVKGIWLMPIQPSPSYHGYDVTDYRGVNPDYGTLADLDALVAAAKERGIGIITDFVLNHSSSEHPWFIDARSGPGATYRDYYTWAPAPIETWHRPWDGANVWHEANGSYFYGLFWSGMPDLNLENEALSRYMVESFAFWLDHGLAGFRVDAARYLFETRDGKLADLPRSIDYITQVREATRAAHPDALYVAEAWTNEDTVAKYYGDGGDAYQLAFSFDLAGAMVSAANGGSRSELVEVLRKTE